MGFFSVPLKHPAATTAGDRARSSAAETSPLMSDPSSQPPPLRSGHKGHGSPEADAKREGRPEEKPAQVQNAGEGVRVGKAGPARSQAASESLALDKFLCLHWPVSTLECRLSSLC